MDDAPRPSNISLASTKSSADSSRCVELALEGERRCRQGDARAGIVYLEAALGAGTDDLSTLSAIYSQLGNAYFYMGDYAKALEYHRHDLTLARTVGDRAGEAKASGNLGNTLKVLGKYDESVLCCQRHLEVSRELSDKIGESRALYNLGNVYHAKGKYFGRLCNYEAGEYPQEARSCLLKAVDYYEQHLRLVQELNDRAAEGRSCGNLGNTFYLLGNFTQAVRYHILRLGIAKQFGDKPAMRRAYSNLGNAHVFLGEFEQAMEYYKQALAIAIELGDSATEAQACYSLGNTATLLGEHEQAIEYHIRHLTIARQLSDKVGQARAAWSLGNAFMSLGQHSKSFYFVLLHMQLSAEIGDLNGESIAEQNLSDLNQILGKNATPDKSADPAPVELNRRFIDSRLARHLSLENSLSKFPSNNAQLASPNISSLDVPGQDPRRTSALSINTVNPLFGSLSGDIIDDEMFFDYLSRAQSKRMDDQRCDPKALLDKENKPRIRATDAPRDVLTSKLSQSVNSLRRSTVKRYREKFVSKCRRLRRVSLINPRNNNASQMDSSAARLDPDALELEQQSVHDLCQSSCESASSSLLPDMSSETNRASRVLTTRNSINNSSLTREQEPDEFIDFVIGIQGRRMNDQRAELAHLPGLQHPDQILGRRLLLGGSASRAARADSKAATSSSTSSSPSAANRENGRARSARSDRQLDDDFVEMLIRCQSARIDEQRSELPEMRKAVTVPDDDFFQLVLKMQARRFEEQRANLANANGQPASLIVPKTADKKSRKR